MTSSAAQRYRELTICLLVSREDAGGMLPQEEEARFAGALDCCWQQMSDDEQNEEERRVRAPSAELE